MSGLDRLELLRLEERSFNAWPALQVAFLDGWVLRFAEGYSKRANSASALHPAGDFEALLPLIVEQYRARAIPCCFRLTPLAPPQAAQLLDAQGWRSLDETSVQVLDFKDCDTRLSSASPPGMQISPSADDRWIDGYAQASARADLRPDTLGRMLAAIASPAAFGTLAGAGEDVAYGMAVLDRGMVGLFDIAVRSDVRGRGHGRRIVQDLLAWGRERGASRAYLQVTTANAPALALYRSLGFREAYRYEYRIPS
jgi:ribosomal protein S18 acetylase RimI-like enzyme